MRKTHELDQARLAETEHHLGAADALRPLAVASATVGSGSARV